MQKIISALLLALVLTVFPTVAQADSFASVTQTTTGAGILFRTTNAKALTQNSRTVAGPGIVVTKLRIMPVTYASATQFTLWDAPLGLTEATGARIVIPTQYIAASTISGADARGLYDFTSGRSYRTDDDGLAFKYHPVIVVDSANTINATIQYRAAPQLFSLPRN